MEIKGEYKIAAPRDKVFAALNDPAILQACIPGCESLEKTSDTEMKAKVRLRIGPVSASFTGKVTLSDIDPPNGYRISGEGQGGVAGFAKGGAVVALRDDGGGTVLDYNVDAQVGGKIAQVGARRDVLARLEAHLPAGLAGRHDLAFHLDEVPRVQRGEELDRFVGAEEALVAVVADEKLGGDVAEEAEHARAVRSFNGTVLPHLDDHAVAYENVGLALAGCVDDASTADHEIGALRQRALPSRAATTERPCGRRPRWRPGR